MTHSAFLPDCSSLPPPAPRLPYHTRQTSFQGFKRDDGLWDVEAQMVDSKPFPFELPGKALAPQQALHRMVIRITFDEQLKVVDIATQMGDYPYGICAEADQHMKRMIGCSMTKGWRQAIEDNLGKVQGCTHMRELLFNMATVAFQTLAPETIRRTKELMDKGLLNKTPPHLAQCHTFDLGSEVVRDVFPMFYQPREEIAGGKE